MKKRILLCAFVLLILILLWSQLFSVFDTTANPVSVLYKPYVLIPLGLITLGILCLAPNALSKSPKVKKISVIIFALFMLLSVCSIAVSGITIYNSRQRAENNATEQSIETRFTAQQFFSADVLQAQPTANTKGETAFYGTQGRFAYHFEQDLTAQNSTDCNILYEVYDFENLSEKEYNKIQAVLLQRYISGYPDKTEQAEIFTAQTIEGEVHCILQEFVQNETHSFYYAVTLRSANAFVLLKMQVYAAGDFTVKNQLQENLDAFFAIQRTQNLKDTVAENRFTAASLMGKTPSETQWACIDPTALIRDGIKGELSVEKLQAKNFKPGGNRSPYNFTETYQCDSVETSGGLPLQMVSLSMHETSAQAGTYQLNGFHLIYVPTNRNSRELLDMVAIFTDIAGTAQFTKDGQNYTISDLAQSSALESGLYRLEKTMQNEILTLDLEVTDAQTAQFSVTYLQT
ncbi:MAG: hypothetical protein Q4E21_05900 [Clostridia bacterium]|nr:hypothetical protein [Clostridia bacterium]